MCKYCDDENKYEICVCHGIWKIWVDKNKLRLYINDIGVEDETTIRYCPMCGKKLGE
jgi:hypothetical protein